MTYTEADESQRHDEMMYTAAEKQKIKRRRRERMGKKTTSSYRKRNKGDLRSHLFSILACAIGTILIAWLYYDRLLGFLPGAAVGVYIGFVAKRMMGDRRQRMRREQFRRLLLSLETALEAGYSLENAFSVAEGDLALIYHKGEEISLLIGDMKRKLSLGIPVWEVFSEYAALVRIEEAEEFSEILRIQQRTGGDLIRTVRQAAARLQESLELRQEIESVVYEKKLEQRIMTVMPSLILLYMRLMNGSYMQPLYQGVGGMLVMTFALAGNIIADRIAASILEKAMPNRDTEMESKPDMAGFGH